MTWVLVGTGWLALALLLAVVVGRAVRIADDRAAADATAHTDAPANFVVDSPAENAMSSAAAPGTTAEPPSTQPPAPTHDTPTVPGIPAARPSADQRNTRRRQTPSPARRSESA